MRPWENLQFRLIAYRFLSEELERNLISLEMFAFSSYSRRISFIDKSTPAMLAEMIFYRDLLLRKRCERCKTHELYSGFV
ncbi:MAG: hypothetical protein A2428_02015 [Bdellovibrionales bacterium RIFOXYC1_FULL_54_43]|nr:MAG: hypothetical protein A2428_02015 [Bdellovibrionales bacterium RIFOXYC1_FULL_54_43]OFZ83217.1 MAG: hypothetical protein A2603_13940 [Bdellovibrionales bacterium RIFOXYD1_FULL_55_31]